MSMTNTLQGIAFDPDRFERAVHQLSPELLDEFNEGLHKLTYRVIVDQTKDATTALLEYVVQWFISIVLQADPEWQRQVVAVDERIAAGDLGPTYGVEDLDTLLGL